MNAGDLVLGAQTVRFRGLHFPCCIGRGGITGNKREGDGATPAGIHRLVGTLFRADRIARPAPWAVPIGLNDIWSDDVTDPGYNQMGRAPSDFSHERLRRGDPLYDLVILTDWNWPRAAPGKGSAIFLHQWRRPGYPTEGCIAFRRDHLRSIAAVAAPGTRLIVQ